MDNGADPAEHSSKVPNDVRRVKDQRSGVPELMLSEGLGVDGANEQSGRVKPKGVCETVCEGARVRKRYDIQRSNIKSMSPKDQSQRQKGKSASKAGSRRNATVR